MTPGEIYLANFPFGGSAGMKLRPVLLLTGPIGDVPEILVVYISSVLPLRPFVKPPFLSPLGTLDFHPNLADTSRDLPGSFRL